MKQWIKALNEQVEKFNYLKGNEEKNMKILQNRIKEIEEEKQRKKILFDRK